MQRAFLEKGAPVEAPEGREIVPRINQLTAMCRILRIPVIFLKMTRGAENMGLLRDMTSRDLDNEMEPTEGKKGADLYPGLDVRQDDYIVAKIRYSALIPGSSTLEPLLRGLGRDSFMICGVATDVCVGATTIDGMMLGFKVFFIGDLTVTFSDERQRVALEVLNKHFAKVITYDEVMKELEGLAWKAKGTNYDKGMIEAIRD